METKTKIYLAGEEFQITTEDASAEELQTMAVSVNSRIEEIRKQYPSFSFDKAILFAAFMLEGELSSLQRRYDALDKTVKQIQKAGGVQPAPAKRAYAPKKPVGTDGNGNN